MSCLACCWEIVGRIKIDQRDKSSMQTLTFHLNVSQQYDHKQHGNLQILTLYDAPISISCRKMNIGSRNFKTEGEILSNFRYLCKGEKQRLLNVKSGSWRNGAWDNISV